MLRRFLLNLVYDLYWENVAALGWLGLLIAFFNSHGTAHQVVFWTFVSLLALVYAVVPYARKAYLEAKRQQTEQDRTHP